MHVNFNEPFLHQKQPTVTAYDPIRLRLVASRLHQVCGEVTIVLSLRHDRVQLWFQYANSMTNMSFPRLPAPLVDPPTRPAQARSCSSRSSHPRTTLTTGPLSPALAKTALTATAHHDQHGPVHSQVACLLADGSIAFRENANVDTTVLSARTPHYLPRHPSG
ncbi:hypothetical protein PLICRDRAFT_39470 [Plicaturopsis crispa FD-325 SS-3]|nr:hypothetical protein PLICRDRAFT_39470 [Plicaturopsis crispa FD-325 SS-3]